MVVNTSLFSVSCILLGCGTSMDIVLRLACSERKMLYSTCSDEMAQLIQQLSQIFKVDQVG